MTKYGWADQIHCYEEPYTMIAMCMDQVVVGGSKLVLADFLYHVNDNDVRVCPECRERAILAHLGDL
jgi:hypothetical protein